MYLSFKIKKQKISLFVNLKLTHNKTLVISNIISRNNTQEKLLLFLNSFLNI
jgi:hypothetical protein